MEKTPALIINQRHIHHLSGPISYRFLEPKNFDTYHTLGLDLPLILLFGDDHSGFDNMCSIEGPEEKDVTLPDIANTLPCNKSKGCYRIYDREFLSLFNELAEQSTYPIDFYSELHNKYQDFYLQRHDQNNNYYKSVLDLINVRSIKCLYPEYRHLCQYPNLRWHYADIRNHQNGVISDLSQFGHNIYNFLESDQLNIDNLYLRISERRLGRLIDVLNNIRFPERGERFDAAYMYDVLFHYIQADETDKIRKQINSQSVDPFNNVGYWKDILIRCFIDHVYTNHSVWSKKLETPIMPSVEIKLFIQKITNSRGIITLSEEEKEMLDILSYFITLIIGPFMDLYFILRIFKTPTPRPGVEPTRKNSSNPTLAIGYFGNAHCSRISYMLSIANLYKSKETKLPPTPMPIRCIHLNGRPIDIDDAVSKHNAKRAPVLGQPIIDGAVSGYSYQEEFLGKKMKNRYLRYFR